MKLNLGCGRQVVPGWVNVDNALGARCAKLPFFRSLNSKLRLFSHDWDPRIFIHDLTKPLPWRTGVADVAYSSHLLEHLTREEGHRLLAECHRVLRKDGILRVVVPDLARVVDQYRSGTVRADQFVESLGVLPSRGGSWLKNRLHPFIQYPHKCMYDAESLLSIVQRLGFRAQSRGAFDSEIEEIGEVELAEHTRHAVIVEGRKR